MEYTIEKNGLQPEILQPAQEQVYVVKHFKTATDTEGKEVTVFDDSRMERVTVAQLEAQKLSHQNAIKDIDSKLEAIAKL